MWQTILNFTTFNHLPGTVYHDETAGSQVWDNNARNRTVAVYEHPIPKSTAWVDCFHALSFSCLDSFLDGWFQICAYYVNVPSLKMWWCSFIFCGWKIKSKPRIGRQETLEDPLFLTIKHGSCHVFFASNHRTTSTILGMFTTHTDPQPSQYPSSSDPRNAIARTTGRKLHAQNMHLADGDGIWH